MIPAAHSRASQRLLNIALYLIGNMRSCVAWDDLRFGCLVLAGNLAAWEAVADAGVEINAFGEGRAKRIGDFVRHVGIDVAPAGHELDPQRVFGLIVYEA